MELASTIEINGEEREIADAYAREQCAANAQKLTEHDSKIYSYKVFTKSGMSYDAESDEIVSSSMYADEVDIAQRVNWHDDALRGVSDTMKAVKKKTDTDIAGLNSNLSQLEFGEESGSGNLCDEEFILGYFNDKGQEFPSTNDIRTKNYIKVKPNTTYYLAGNDVVVVKLNESKTPIGYILWRKSNVAFTTDENTHYIGLARPGVTTYSHDIAIIEGASGSYVPYIPSVKMLAEENSQQSIEAMDLKMLGWSVPKECPVQNYVDSDGVFHQRVGRVDLGSLDWIFYNEERCIFISNSLANIKSIENLTIVPNLYVKGYTTVSSGATWINKNISMAMPTSIIICDTNYTTVEAFKNAMKGQYLYYELATPITMTIDGNEAVTKVNESLDNQGLLNKVTEMRQGKWNISSGVSEGGDYYVSSKESISCNGNSNIKLKCDNAEAFDIVFFNGSSFISGESKNGSELLFTAPSNAISFKFNIYNGNKLTPQNVGKIEVYVDSQIEQLKNDLGGLKFSASGTTLTITDGTNTWSLTAN